MKKLIMIVLAACGISLMASEYQVYDFAMTLKTTAAKGKVTTSCGDSYVWRESKNMKIRGVIAGCGCGAILANGVCANARVLLWNETTKQQISNDVISAWVVQRIGKKGEKVEHMATLKADDFELALAGFGSWKGQSLKSLSGNCAGIATAPWLVPAGSCTACGETPIDQSIAVAPCEDGICTEADDSDITPMYGNYVLKYNTSKSKKISKNGISAKLLGCPSYVNVNEGSFD